MPSCFSFERLTRLTATSLLALALTSGCGGCRDTIDVDEPGGENSADNNAMMDRGEVVVEEDLGPVTDGLPACATACGQRDRECVPNYRLMPMEDTDPRAVVDFASSVAFLHAAGDERAVQVCASQDLDPLKVGVIRGRVIDRAGEGIPGVRVELPGMPEAGHTYTREDGVYDLAIEAGRRVTVRFYRRSYISVERQVKTTRRDFAWVPETVLTPRALEATRIDGARGGVALGAVREDEDGQRRISAVFRPDTSAKMRMPDGTMEPVEELSVRMTEYTVGEAGRGAMPGALPGTSAYTYAVELELDGSEGADSVVFDKPVAIHLDNFLDMPTGTPVPVGFYDRETHTWETMPDGIVLEVLGEEGGRARVDVDGDGSADGSAALTVLGIDDVELEGIASRFEAGDTLWRVQVEHFSPYDFNYGFTGPDFDPQGEGPKKKNKDQEPCQKSGSIIECENQVFGEVIPILGTTSALSYRSDRTGAGEASTTIGLTREGEDLSALARIEVEALIAGQRHVHVIEDPGPGQSWTFEWDGRDGFGRDVFGAREATIIARYFIRARYTTPAPGGASFGAPGDAERPVGDGGRVMREVTRSFKVNMGQLDVRRSHALGGWMLDSHAVYDANARKLYPGFGPERGQGDVSRVVSGALDFKALDESGELPFPMQGAAPRALVSADDGTILLVVQAADQHGHQVVSYDPDLGQWTHIAGRVIPDMDDEWSACLELGECGFGGDAKEALLLGDPGGEFSASGPYSVAHDPITGGVYLSSGGACIMRVDARGILHREVGVCRRVTLDDRLTAPEELGKDHLPFVIQDLAVAPSGELYWSEFNRVIKREPGGNLTVYAAGGDDGEPDDGQDARELAFSPETIIAAPDGTLYMKDPFFVVRVGLDRRIEVLFRADIFNDQYILDIALSNTGELYIADDLGIYRHVDGGVELVAAGTPFDEVPAYDYARRVEARDIPAQAAVARIFDIAVGEEETLWSVFVEPETTDASLREIYNPFPSVSDEETLIPTKDGIALHVFDRYGMHLRDIYALDGSLIRAFEYDEGYRLIGVRDSDGLTTTIERDVEGLPVAIVGPYGMRTSLTVNEDGWLDAITLPDETGFTFTYDARGLMTEMTDLGGDAKQMEYDEEGLLTRHIDANGGILTLAKEGENGVKVTSREGYTTTYENIPSELGTRKRVTGSDGLLTEYLTAYDGSITVTSPDGLVATMRMDPDERFGYAAPRVGEQVLAFPSGKTLTIRQTREATLADPRDLFSLTRDVETTTVIDADGVEHTASKVFDVAARTYRATTPEGRWSEHVYDEEWRLIEERTPGRTPITYAYDELGRTISVAQGSRALTYTYNAQGITERVEDGSGAAQITEFDDVGQPIRWSDNGATGAVAYRDDGTPERVTLPGGEVITYTYDALDRMTRMSGALGVGEITREYNRDGQTLREVLADGRSLSVSYDEAGRLETIETPDGVYGYRHDEVSGRLVSITSPAGDAITHRHDGPMLTGVAYSGAVAAELGFAYDAMLRLSAFTIGQSSEVVYGYDNDGLMTEVGAMTLTWHPERVELVSTTLGEVEQSHAYTPEGALSSLTYTTPGNDLLTLEYGYDQAGMLTSIARQLAPSTALETFDYEFDMQGRLASVRRDGAPYCAYVYDAQGNITEMSCGGVTRAGVYDEADRVKTFGERTYAYNQHGQVTSWEDGAGDRITLDYDVLDGLRGVTGFGRGDVAYTLDATGRRIARSVDGAITHRWVYQSGSRIAAEVDETGEVITRFVYAGDDLAPAYMIRGGETYRLLKDHVSTVYAVVNVASGDIVQRITYSPFGEVFSDSNPGFQPFGFAGGHVDEITGLVRFGARDYDPYSARWLSRDPMELGSGDVNMYAYATGDPINFSDPTGEAADTLLDAAFIAYDLGRIFHDNILNDCGNLGENMTALGADSLGLLIPFATGLGAAVRVGRGARATRQVNQATKTGCFDEDAAVLRCDGRMGPISEVEAGDCLLAMDVDDRERVVELQADEGGEGAWAPLCEEDRSCEPDGVLAAFDASAFDWHQVGSRRTITPWTVYALFDEAGKGGKAVMFDGERWFVHREYGAPLFATAFHGEGGGEDLSMGSLVLFERARGDWALGVLADALSGRSFSTFARGGVYFEASREGGGGWRIRRTGRRAARVTRPLVREAREGLVVVRAGGLELRGTPEHPFFVRGRQDFVPMGELEVGMTLARPSGDIIVTAIERLEVSERVYNVELDSVHTYFVGGLGGTDAVLVHNICGKRAAKIAKWMKPKWGTDAGLRRHYARHASPNQIDVATVKAYDESARRVMREGRQFDFVYRGKKRVGYYDAATEHLTVTMERGKKVFIKTHYQVAWDAFVANQNNWSIVFRR